MTDGPNINQVNDDELRELARWLNPVDPRDGLDTIPEEPEAKPVNRRIAAIELCSLAPKADPAPVDEVRKQILATLHEHADSKKPFRLLVGAPAGSGKSHQGIAFVQERAALGERWLWAAQNHAMFEDLSSHSNFDPALWYHWQPTDGQIDGEPACRYAGAQRAWTSKGYKAWNLCRQLCGRKKDYNDPTEETYMDTCPYRCQGQKRQPVVFCMHQHLYSGLDAGAFDGIIIDESFVSLIAREQYVPGKDLKQGSINLAVVDLAKKLMGIWDDVVSGDKPSFFSGKALMQELGETYVNAAIQLQEINRAPEFKEAAKHYRNPDVREPGQVNDLQTIYMDDLVKALEPEYKAFMNDKQHWAERVWMDRNGLHYVMPAELWPDLPKRIVILDATGLAEFYRHALKGAVIDYKPAILRKGNLYQIAGRQNGKGVSMERKPTKAPKTKNQKYDTELSKAALEFVEVAREIISMRDYKNVAVITFQQVEKMIAEALNLPANKVMHFFKLRGRNDFQDCDAVFIYGTPSPSERTVTNIMLALDKDRIEPIYEIGPDGKHKPLYVPKLHEFRLSNRGLALWKEVRGEQYNGAVRMVGGYKDPMAATIQAQLREAELLQAIYRARLITNPADVWVFSAVPTDEPVDGLFDDPPIAPGKLGWKMWLKIHAWCEEHRGERFGYSELAAGIETREDYLRTKKALDAIQEYYGAEIECIRLPGDNLNKRRERDGLVISING